MTTDPKTWPATGRDLFTQSAIKAFNKCRRYYQYKYEIGITPAVTSKPLRMGRAFHLGMELLAKADPAWDEKKWDQYVNEAVLAAIIDYKNEPPNFVTLEEWLVEREVVGRLLKVYSWRWQNEKIKILAAEIPYKQPLRDPATGRQMFKLIPSKSGPPQRVLLWRAGVIDKIIEKPDGKLAILEHKTTGDSVDPKSDYWIEASMSIQPNNYLLAGTEAGFALQGVEWDVVRKPGIEPRKLSRADTQAFLGLAVRKGKNKIVPPEEGAKGVYCNESFVVEMDGVNDLENPDNNKIERVLVDGQLAELLDDEGKVTIRETPAMYGARLMADVMERPDFYFARREVPRTAADMDEFMYDMSQTVEAIQHCQRTEHWPRNVASCKNPFPCEFFGLCSNHVQVTIDGEPPERFVRLTHVHPEIEGRLPK